MVLLAVLASVLVIVASGVVGWRLGSASGARVDDAAPTIPDSVPVVVFLGDSYSEGVGASTFGKRWTTLASAALGWSEINASAAGMGYTTSYEGQPTDYSTRVDVVAAARPDIVVISGGRNDLQAGSPTDVRSAAATLFARVEAAAPAARVLVVGPLWDSSTPPAAFADLRSSVRQAAMDANVENLDIGQPLAGDDSLIASDHLHPSDLGHRAIAETVVMALH